MLNKIELNRDELNKDYYNDYEKFLIDNLIKEVESGKDIMAYKKTTKKGVFINRYEKDKTRGRYILTHSIQTKFNIKS